MKSSCLLLGLLLLALTGCAKLGESSDASAAASDQAQSKSAPGDALGEHDDETTAEEIQARRAAYLGAAEPAAMKEATRFASDKTSTRE